MKKITHSDPEKSKNDSFDLKKIILVVLVSILTLFLILSFIGVVPITGNSSNQVGRINGTSVLKTRDSTYYNIYENFKQRFIEQGTSSFDEETDNFISQQAFEQLARQTLLTDYGKKHKIDVSSKEIVERFKYESFVNPETGEYNPADYNRWVSQVENARKSQIQNRVKDNLISSYLNSLFIYPVLSTTERVFENHLSSIKNRFLILSFSFASRIEEAVTQKDVSNYYEANKLKYKSQPLDEIFIEVEADYINENSSTLKEQLQSKYLQVIQDSLKKYNYNFKTIAQKIGAEIFETKWTSYLDTEIYRKNESIVTKLDQEKKREIIKLKKTDAPYVFVENQSIILAIKSIENQTRSPLNLAQIQNYKNLEKLSDLSALQNSKTELLFQNLIEKLYNQARVEYFSR